MRVAWHQVAGDAFHDHAIECIRRSHRFRRAAQWIGRYCMLGVDAQASNADSALPVRPMAARALSLVNARTWAIQVHDRSLFARPSAKFRFGLSHLGHCDLDWNRLILFLSSIFLVRIDSDFSKVSWSVFRRFR